MSTPSDTDPPSGPPDTGDLAAGARGGDQGRFGELYGRLAPSLHAWAQLRIRPGFRRAVSPEDLVQEVWLRAAQVLHAFNPAKSSFRAWIFAVAKNVLLEVQRKLHRTWKDQTPEGDTGRALALDQVPESITSLTRRVARDEAVRRFVERAEALDEDDRRVLVHCGLEELTIAEAAGRLGLSPDATAKRWQRLRERIREWRAPRDLVAGDDG